ncbi:hypothetical protein V6N13_101050 [Hibiscus sabdariffa]|uniref:Uncharacterized protein n=1 Tax=Hibiscus sabdariffa TaxID=183260 RepID=A0ABR2QKV2_9ROSI
MFGWGEEMMERGGDSMGAESWSFGEGKKETKKEDETPLCTGLCTAGSAYLLALARVNRSRRTWVRVAHNSLGHAEAKGTASLILPPSSSKFPWDS